MVMKRVDLSPLLFMGELNPLEKGLLKIAELDGNFVLDEGDLVWAGFRGIRWPDLGWAYRPDASMDARIFVQSAKDYLDRRLRYWPIVHYFMARSLQGAKEWRRLQNILTQADALKISPGDLQVLLLTPGYNVASPDHTFSTEERLTQLESHLSSKKSPPGWLLPR